MIALSLSLAVLVVLFGFIFTLYLRVLKRERQLQDELINLRTSEARAQEAKSQLEGQVGKLNTQFEEQSEKNSALQSEKARLEAELQNVQTRLKEEREQLDQAQKRLQESFESLAAKALRGNSEQFIQLAQETFKREQQAATSDLEKRQTAIQTLVGPLKESLEQYQKRVSDIELARTRAYTSIEDQLKTFSELSQNLSKETSALKDALKKPHIRGRWGEVQLKNCVELAGMSEYSDVTFQDSTDGAEGNRLIPDMTVRMPGGRLVVVDCKTPIDAFLASLEAQNDDVRQAEMIRHGKHVKSHVQTLATKDYGKNIEGAADFTVMFLPNESFLYAALESEPDLVEFALQKKVLIATPPTLIGLLKVIRYGWNEEKLAENASRISKEGQELHKRICDFVDAYVNVGKHLDKAREEYDKGMSRLERRVLVQARRLEKLGAKSHKDLPPGLGELEESESRQIEAPQQEL
ncbi:MAG: DNA recombination protein RmuC [Bdellovibrionaceae bacterium]|nr:DNA recombination protein RmuC [Pseudobdellovibrionaceae bacterium]